jgi:predicted enzyme related to lactoylglutathione lyase
VLPVADVDRAKAFYAGLGWRLDADISVAEDYRVVQFTPPNSPASIQFGTDMTSGAPGSVQNLYLATSDIAASRDDLVAHGAEVSEVFHPAAFGDQFHPAPSGHVGGKSPNSYSSFATFSDPDGNGWFHKSHEQTSGASTPRDVVRVPTVGERDAARRSRPRQQKRTGQADANWPDWHAD